jgi:hypothetical protein
MSRERQVVIRGKPLARAGAPFAKPKAREGRASGRERAHFFPFIRCWMPALHSLGDEGFDVFFCPPRPRPLPRRSAAKTDRPRKTLTQLVAPKYNDGGRRKGRRGAQRTQTFFTLITLIDADKSFSALGRLEPFGKWWEEFVESEGREAERAGTASESTWPEAG